jgi:phenylpropionate dioxygenase-like ring-hydroxylating dioxygenase large terminal subunit
VTARVELLRDPMAPPPAVMNGWLPVLALKSLGEKPVSRSIGGVPIVLFKDERGRPVAMRDRCPHRNVALSEGRVVGGTIECPYHGWRFNNEGRCVLTPGMSEPARIKAEAMPVELRGGLIWTSLSREPGEFPVIPHPVDAPGFDTFVWPIQSRAFLIDAIENLLDPAHPHFLHPGIVRSSKTRRTVEVEVTQHPRHVEAVYHERSRPDAWMPRLLEGERMTSVGRFFPPTTAQLAFEGQDGTKLAITAFFSPLSTDRVQAFAHFATPKGRAPAWMKQLILRAFHIPVLAQDEAMMRRQAENVERFGGPKYAYGPMDFLRREIQALMAGEELTPGETRHTCAL